jgi:ABC-type nitrate/sulfonate/bicarbonate transport system permease component
VATTFAVVGLFIFFPVYFAVSSAVAGVDKELVRMCRSFGGRDRHVLGGIVVPTTVPAVISGLRLGVGRGLIGLVVLELFMGRGGLGSVILDSVNQGRPNVAMLAVMVLGCANLAATGVLQLLQGRVESWRPRRATA